uniref:Uncharacterized protein n=1 Tax=Triticum urartu TaxID=4572 RepID=A0A8R7UFI0_TRIUA
HISHESVWLEISKGSLNRCIICLTPSITGVHMSVASHAYQGVQNKFMADKILCNQTSRDFSSEIL